MKPEDNSLDSGYDASHINATLEGGYQTSSVSHAPLSPQAEGVSMFKFSKLALIIMVCSLLFLGLLGGGSYIFDKDTQ